VGHDAAARGSLVERRLARGLYRTARAERWDVPVEDFTEALERSARHRFADDPARDPAAVRRYLEALHLEDLALACACIAGHEGAWQHFITTVRPALYGAARAIAGDSAGREIADSLYGDLYGTEVRAGTRRSLFLYYHGRSRLLTWLRSVIAQRQVDVVRAARRTTPIDEVPAIRVAAAGTAHEGRALADVEHRHVALMQQALRAAIALLTPADRLRLAYYYVQDLTLAQIGRLLGEHEATVSRKLERARRAIRSAAEQHLREQCRLSSADVQLCLEATRHEWPFDLTSSLAAESPDAAEGSR
jgi:RNA polymerase sigma-70 factor